MEYLEMINRAVLNAKVIKMNRNSVVLEFLSKEKMYCSRRVFNAIQADPEIPIYSVEKTHQGVTTEWLAVPLTT